MVLNPAPSVKTFAYRISRAAGLSRPQRALLVVFFMGILLVRGKKRSLAAIGRTVAQARRYRGQLSRATRNPRFRTRDLYRAAFAERLGQQERAQTWIVAIDDVATCRGGFTKIENGQHKRKAPEKPGKKVKASSKSHTFVMGLLMTDSGARIPLPRKTWRTREYARKTRKKYLSKVALAVQMVRELKPLVPEHVKVFVVADELYEGQAMFDAVRQLGWTFVSNADSRRVFSDVASDAEPSERKLHAYGLALPRSAFRPHVLVRGKENSVAFRRYTPDEAKRDDRRVFRVAHEARGVAKLGTVGIVYSWKSPVYRPRRDRERETYKVLVCSDSSLPPEIVAELYDLRWQVEVFFRELKSGLGLADYQGQDFPAFERLVDLTLLTYLFLDQRREECLAKAASPAAKARLTGARTTQLKREVEREAVENDLTWLETALASKRGRRRLRRLLRSLRGAV
jgi:hypothetical protein